MSFELVNHQIMHMFGGIEAEKNSSLESLENVQRKIFRAMEKAQLTYKKMYQAITTVKESLLELSNNYLGLSRDNKHSGKLINKLHFEVNELFQRMAEESNSLWKKMQSKAESYSPNFKKLKEKYTECADNLEHYKQKVVLLRKNVEKQSLTKIKQDEHQRYERNKDKLKKAESDHDEILLKITKRFVEFNSEGVKDLYFDLLTIMSAIGSQMMTAATSITHHLHGSFTTKEILLAREVRSKSKRKIQKQACESIDGRSSLQEEPRYCDNKAIWLDYLIEQKQLSNYLKTLMDREMSKAEPGLPIRDYFKKESLEDKENQEEVITPAFDQFHNQYNSQALQLKQKNLFQEVKQFKEDTVLHCEDLLSVEELTVMSPSVAELDESQLVEADYPEFENTKQQEYRAAEQERIKQNLEKFNEICEKNKNNNNKPRQSVQISNFKSTIVVNHRVSQKQQTTVNAGEFFNIFDSNRKKQEANLPKPQIHLQKTPDHPAYFDFFATTPVKDSKHTVDNYRGRESHVPARRITTENTQFEVVDFFGKKGERQEVDLAKKNQKNEIKSPSLLAAQPTKKGSTLQHSFDLLNL